jgi:hypothetical protein
MSFDRQELEDLRGTDPVMDCLWQSALHDLQARAMPLHKRLHALVSGRILAEAHVSVAPVRFGARLFHLDEEGVWSVLIPMTDETGWIVNIAAFDPNGPRVATLNLNGCAAGLEELAHCWIAERAFRPRLHLSWWSWLKAECCGVLPVDWHATALYLKERRVDGVIAPDVDSGRMIERRLQGALGAPPVFVAGAEMAA